MLRLWPVLVLGAGAAIHVAALTGHKIDGEPLWTDALFLAIDLALMIGLLARVRLAYWLAAALFLHQTVVQGYWAGWQLINGEPRATQMVAAALAAATLLVLLATRQLHAPNDRPEAEPTTPAD